MKLFSERFETRLLAARRLMITCLVLGLGFGLAANAAAADERQTPSTPDAPKVSKPSKPPVEASNEQKMLAMFSEKERPAVASMLRKVGEHREKVAGVVLSVPAGYRQFALFTLLEVPQNELASLDEQALANLVGSLAQAVSRAGQQQQRPLIEALCRAGDNRDEMFQTLGAVKDEHQKAAAFLIMNMPERDLHSLKKDFLVEQITLAHEAWEKAPWHDDIPEPLFLQYILPYANLNERRDNWRPDFMERLHEKAWTLENPVEVVQWLNKELNDIFNVHFHATKRPKADQSPFESIEAGYASCTGLSVLLVDACRSVGVPARLVGVPEWTKKQGNHNWVEIWDGEWYNAGGTNLDKRQKNWVNNRCKNQTDPDDWRHMVYAACFRKSSTHFPMVWDYTLNYVPALNITRFYSDRKETDIEIPGGGKGVVEVYWAGEIIARAEGEKSVSFGLGAGNHYKVHITTDDGKLHKQALRL